ncbi:MAG: hypothetical protein QM490_01825 [Candidatus Gracilibacteria bacterium]
MLELNKDETVNKIKSILINTISRNNFDITSKINKDVNKASLNIFEKIEKNLQSRTDMTEDKINTLIKNIQYKSIEELNENDLLDYTKEKREIFELKKENNYEECELYDEFLKDEDIIKSIKYNELKKIASILEDKKSTLNQIKKAYSDLAYHREIIRETQNR